MIEVFVFFSDDDRWKKETWTCDVYYCSFNSIYPLGIYIHTFDLLLEHPFAERIDPWKNDQLLIRSVHYFRCLSITRDFFFTRDITSEKKIHVMRQKIKSTWYTFFLIYYKKLFWTYQYTTWDSFNAWIDFWNLSQQQQQHTSCLSMEIESEYNCSSIDIVNTRSSLFFSLSLTNVSLLNISHRDF